MNVTRVVCSGAVSHVNISCGRFNIPEIIRVRDDMMVIKKSLNASGYSYLGVRISKKAEGTGGSALYIYISAWIPWHTHKNFPTLVKSIKEKEFGVYAGKYIGVVP